MSRTNYWRARIGYVTLRSVLASSWKAKGLLLPIWHRLEGKGKREQLAALVGVAPNDLSAINTGNKPMTAQLALRIASAVPGVTPLDLRPPQEAEAVLDPGVFDRLRELEDAVNAAGPRLDDLARRVADLETRVPPKTAKDESLDER